MSVTRKGDSVEQDTKAILKAILKNKRAIQLPGAQCIRATLRRRIFSNGGATSGNIGSYAASTKRIRKKAGRQISKVDLQFLGDQSKGLFSALNVVQFENNFVVGIERKPETGASKLFTDDNARIQEEHFKKEIFAPSVAEIKKCQNKEIKVLDAVVKIALRKTKKITKKLR